MFYFGMPYMDMFMRQYRKHKTRPTVLHHQTCSQCDRKLVNVYYSAQLEGYICKQCMDILLAKGKDNAEND